MLNVYEQVDRNKKRSLLIVCLFVSFVVFVAWLFARFFDMGTSFVGFALIFSGVMSYASYYWGDKIILSVSRARPADKTQDFNLFTVTENLAMLAHLPMPQLYVIDDPAPNAFATGRDPQHAVVCATTGLINKLDRTELEGVIAHELSHVQNYDTRLMAIVTILVGMVSLLGDWFFRSRFRSRDNDDNSRSDALFFAVGLVFALLSPIVAKLIQLAVSRQEEYLADASAAKMTRFPEGLARALEKISDDRNQLAVATSATAHLYIVNPFKSTGRALSKAAYLFNTHPPIEKRIEILRGME